MTDFWTGALALTILLYITLDGFDLGVGMLFSLARGEEQKRHMLASIAPVWDGNETWLVLNVTILFAVFPLAYAALLSAFYLPLLVMLAALVFRGVAFEFREKGSRTRPLWDAGFIGGSFVATFIQGVAVGALVEGLPFEGTRYVGGALGMLSPFALFSGLGLCIGYALLGAGWLTYKTTHDVQAMAFRLLPWLLAGMLAFLGVAFAAALNLHLQVAKRWAERPLLIVFPMIGVLACAVMARALVKRKELTPFLCGLAIFAAALGTLAGSFYPYMIPYSITIADAVGPKESVAFLFWGAGVFVLPVTLVYTLVVYLVFKGKVAVEEDY